MDTINAHNLPNYPLSHSNTALYVQRITDVQAFLPRNRMLARTARYAVVCPSVRPAVTNWSSTKSAKRSITQTMSHDSH